MRHIETTRLIKPALATLAFSILSACQTSVSELPQSAIAKPVVQKNTQPVMYSDPFREAVNQAMAAAEQVQTAHTADQWQGVIDRWQAAIDLMKAVPEGSQHHPIAQQKVTEYTHNRQYAQQQLAAAPSDPAPLDQARLGPAPANETPFSRFAQKLKEADPDGAVILTVKHETAGGISIVTVIVNWAWYTLSRSEQASMTIALRNLWKADCDCELLMLQLTSPASRKLVYILGVGAPEFAD